MDQKLFILGLDGATFDLIKPWAAEGKLPNLAELLATGVHGTLNSPLPPISPPSWASFATGKNPGQHGIFAFTRADPTSYRLRFDNSRTRQGKSFWRIMSEAGARVGALNVPLTYPPEEVNGFVVGGLFSPGLGSNFVSPPEVQRELLAAVPDYIIECFDIEKISLRDKDKSQEYLDKNLRMIDARMRAARSLYVKHKPDCMIAAFVASDRVSHYFWKHMDESSADQVDPVEREKYRDAILTIYQKLDWALGEIRAMLEPGTALFVISDHGFGPSYTRLNFKKWLAENKYLAFAKARPLSPAKAMANLALGAVRYLPMSWRNWGRVRFPRLANRAVSAMLLHDIDWSRTRAYIVAEQVALFINMKGRQPQGIVEPGEKYERLRDELIDKLTHWIDPNTGLSVAERVYRREELYTGTCTERLPDLVIGWRDYQYTFTPDADAKQAPLFSSLLPLPIEKWARCGMHRPNGIFLAHGEGLRGGAETGPHPIWDVAATALYHLGLDVPNDMDGRVMTDIYDPGVIGDRPPSYSGVSSSREAVEREFSEEEEQKIEQRLRNLGYLE